MDSDGSDCNDYEASAMMDVWGGGYVITVQLNDAPIWRENYFCMIRTNEGFEDTTYTSSQHTGRVTEYKPSSVSVEAGKTFSTTVEEQVRIDRYGSTIVQVGSSRPSCL